MFIWCPSESKTCAAVKDWDSVASGKPLSCIHSLAESIPVLPLQEPADDERMQQAGIETVDTLANLGRFGILGGNGSNHFRTRDFYGSLGIFKGL